jgi:hypothetical protein
MGGACVVLVGEAATGFVFKMHDLTTGAVLIGAERGLFRFDPAAEHVTPVGGGAIGAVDHIHDLPDGAVLIYAENGWFRFDPAAGPMTAVGGAATGRPGNIHNLLGGVPLIVAERGLFRLDPAAGLVMPLDKAARGGVHYVHDLAGGGVLIGALNGWFHFDPTAGRVMPVDGVVTGSVYDMHDLAGSGVLIGTDTGLFRFNLATTRVVPVGDATGAVYHIHDLPDGAVMIGAANGLFRFDSATGRVMRVDGEATGGVYNMHDLAGGGLLIPAKNGWFRYDSATARVVLVGRAATDPLLDFMAEMHDLPGGAVLMRATNRWFRFDPVAEQVMPAGEVGTTVCDEVHSLPNGTSLIHNCTGLLMVPSRPLSEAGVEKAMDFGRLKPSNDWVEVRLKFSHPCAPASGNLGLTLAAEAGVTGRQEQPVRRIHDPLRQSANEATLATSIKFNRAGEWTLQLRQGPTAIGQPLRFSLAARTASELLSAWKIVLAIIAGLYALAFAVLLLLTRRHTGAFRILSDSVWAKFLTLPFFFLRHMPAVQRWVLEPWYQAVRRSTQTEVRFLDPPVSNASGAQTQGSGLLQYLHDTPRLWLQGRSGMGKSSIFAAWERAYFGAQDAPRLSAAARRYGFILIMLPVRHYAALPPLETNRPESWVLEAVRRRLEEFGLAIRDLGLIEAMLKAGHIALALDGTNEADRDAAITAFARQFPQVRLLVTSQAAGAEGWEVWRLPEDVVSLRDGLLALWLGTERGALLSRRIVAEGLSDSIVSGYDLRLVADLAGADPERAPLPANRIALYRARHARTCQRHRWTAAAA